jgi:hypothetical protein
MAIYNIARAGLINGTIDLDTDTIQAALITTTYTPTYTEATTTTSLAQSIGTDQTLAVTLGTGANGGQFDAADPTWTAVAGGDTISGCLIFKFVTNDSDSIPIAWLELTDTATNGGDITVNFDTGTNRIFNLTG